MLNPKNNTYTHVCVYIYIYCLNKKKITSNKSIFAKNKDMSKNKQINFIKIEYN